MTPNIRYINHHSGKWLLLSLLLFFAAGTANGQTDLEEHTDSIEATDSANVRKILFLGDSMTGWMAERLNAYGAINDFEVATIVWDGSTIAKWANSPRLKEIISQQKPDAIIVSLGMNEMLERNPQRRLEKPVDKLLAEFGDMPLLWIGPPSWPWQKDVDEFNDWMQQTLGKKRYFNSNDLEIRRQSKSNPHPSRDGIEEWIDNVAEWMPGNSELSIDSLAKPDPGKFSRGKTFVYRRMKEKL